MLYAFTWSVVVALLALWSLLVWALHGAAAWAVGQAGALGGVDAALRLPSWLAAWVPPEIVQWAEQAAMALAPVIQSVLQAAPAMTGAVTLAAWSMWTVGSALLLLLGAGLHALIVVWRRPPTPPAGARATAV